MRVIFTKDRVYPDAEFGTTAVTIGNFDGCHRGHKCLIKNTLEAAQSTDAHPVALTFVPHPDEFFAQQNHAGVHLFTQEQKVRAFAELGLDTVIFQTFNLEFSHLTRDDFFHKYLLQRLAAKAVVIGSDFRFGYQRAGNSDFLKEQALANHVQLFIGEPVSFQGQPISSTRIRKELTELGNVDDAAAMLGHNYLVEGRIMTGNKLGRTIGVPTINLEKSTKLIPKTGVYAGLAWIETISDGSCPSVTSLPKTLIPAAINVGYRPTTQPQTTELRVEAHLIDQHFGHDALYGRHAGLYFVARIRDEQKFQSLEELKSAIHRDLNAARQILSQHRANV